MIILILANQKLSGWKDRYIEIHTIKDGGQWILSLRHETWKECCSHKHNWTGCYRWDIFYKKHPLKIFDFQLFCPSTKSFFMRLRHWTYVWKVPVPIPCEASKWWKLLVIANFIGLLCRCFTRWDNHWWQFSRMLFCSVILYSKSYAYYNLLP